MTDREQKDVYAGCKGSTALPVMNEPVAIGDLIGEFESPVKALDDLFQPAILSRYGVIISKTYDLDKVEIHILKQSSHFNTLFYLPLRKGQIHPVCRFSTWGAILLPNNKYLRSVGQMLVKVLSYIFLYSSSNS
jgi:hypothetical protein